MKYYVRLLGYLKPYVWPYFILGMLCMLAFGAMNWTAEWYRPDSGRGPQVVIDQLVTVVLDGLRSELGSPS